MFSTGDKPGKGSYVCERCRIAVDLSDDSELLPYCPCCEANTYMVQRWNKREE